MAMSVRSSHLTLAADCLALLHLLAHDTTGGHHLVHGHTNTDITVPPHVSVLLPLLSDASPTAASHHCRAPPSLSTLLDASPPRRLYLSAISREDTTASTSPCPCPYVRGVHTRAAVIVAKPRAPAGVTSPARKENLLDALPLLAVPFLPPLGWRYPPWCPPSAPSPPTTAPGWHMPPAPCTATTTTAPADRAQPFADLLSVSQHPLCHAGSDKRARSTDHAQYRGRHGDAFLFHSYCALRTLEMETVAEGDAWRIMPVHLPIDDPDAVVAAGGEVCYVELEHMNYSEGYYIRCPVRDCRALPHRVLHRVPARRHLRRGQGAPQAGAWYTNLPMSLKTQLDHHHEL
ncbi:hypothetical protein ACP70R_022234 [Stipagrostis hirtigluma subsp. patula]